MVIMINSVIGGFSWVDLERLATLTVQWQPAVISRLFPSDNSTDVQYYCPTEKKFCIAVSSITGSRDVDGQNALCFTLGIVSSFISQKRIKLTLYANRTSY